MSLRFRPIYLLCTAACTIAIAGCDSKKPAEQDKPQANTSTADGLPTTPTTTIDTNGTTAQVESQTDWTSLPEIKGPITKKQAAKTPEQIARDGIPTDATLKGFVALQGGQKPTGFRVSYAPTQKYGQFRQAFQKERFFEKIAQSLNGAIKMPAVVDIQMVDCGTVNAFYDPRGRRIIMCYELLDYFTHMFKPISKNNDELGASILGATFFAFYHELGHGLKDVLKLPTTGREEDVADQLATLVLLDEGDPGVAKAMAGARWFALQAESQKKTGQTMPFWDEHSMGEQRFYNVACWIYGSNPNKYKPLVANKYLPEKRAVRCPKEFHDMATAFTTLLKPHLKTGGQQGKHSKPAPAPQTDPNDWGTQKPAPTPTPTPAAQDITCQQVMTHWVQVVQAVATRELAKLPAAQAEKIRQNLASQLPLQYQANYQRCESTPWSQALRHCYGEAQDLAQMTKCDNSGL